LLVLVGSLGLGAGCGQQDPPEEDPFNENGIIDDNDQEGDDNGN